MSRLSRVPVDLLETKNVSAICCVGGIRGLASVEACPLD